MTAAILSFCDHLRAPVSPSARVIQVRPAYPAPLPSTRELALMNLKAAYHGVLRGSARSLPVVKSLAQHVDPDVADLARQLLHDLSVREAEAPSDVEPDGAA